MTVSHESGPVAAPIHLETLGFKERQNKMIVTRNATPPDWVNETTGSRRGEFVNALSQASDGEYIRIALPDEKKAKHFQISVFSRLKRYRKEFGLTGLKTRRDGCVVWVLVEKKPLEAK